MSKSNVALVLGSGGARGLAHIGVLKALHENNVPVHLVTGTSMGALIGGLYASGVEVAAMEKIVHEVDKLMVARIFIPKLFAPGFIDNKRIISFIKELAGDINIEDMPVPFSSVATDFITGEEVIFNKGPLVEAIMASIAIPTVLQPVFIKGRCLIDGGLNNPLPVSVAKSMGAKKIVAVNVSPSPRRITKKIKNKKTEELKILVKKLPGMFAKLLNEDRHLPGSLMHFNRAGENENIHYFSPTIINVFLQSISITTNNLMEHHLRLSAPDVLISPDIEDFDMLDFYKGEEIIKKGYTAAIEALPQLRACRIM